MKKYIPLLIILAAASFLLLANLGNQYLWQDEAETAVLARNVLKFGFPRAHDGVNLVNPTIRTGYGPGYSWLYHPWGQFYLTALSFKLLGESTFSARLPFAFLGILNILLIYLLAYRWTRVRFVAGCSAFLTATSVPYLLLMRQCRYYSPAVFLVLSALLAYDRYLERRLKRYAALLAAVLALLGYTVHGMFLPLSLALAVHYLVFRFDKRSFPVLAAAGAAAFAAVLPWLLYSNSAAHVAAVTSERLWKNLEFQIRMINKFIFPLFFFLSVYAGRLILARKWEFALSDREKGAVKTILTVIAVNILAFCFAEERNLRYLVYFIPLLAVIQGMILLRLARKNRGLLSLFLAVSVLTGVFNMGTPSFLLPKYLYEITHDYDGPVEGIVKFLRHNAAPGDTVKISYGDLPVMFYTDLEVDNSRVLDPGRIPDWLVFRRWWDGKESLGDAYYVDLEKTHEKYVLDYPDIPWENRPGDIGHHRFATDKKAPGVVIFGRR